MVEEQEVTGASAATFQYRFSLTPREDGEMRERHDWCLIGKQGAINIWAEPMPSTPVPMFSEKWFGGVECHWATPPRYLKESEPHHEVCWLICKPCWHDGSSLYFSERVQHLLPAPTGKQMDGARNQFMLNMLRDWFNDKFAESAEVEDSANV